MKKLFILLLTFAMLTALTACDATESKPVETAEISVETVPATPETEEETIFTIIEAKDCFSDAGFVELIAGAMESSEYTFTAENSDDTEWYVYIFDQAFDEGFRYIKQAAEPVLVGDGTILIDEGQYIYVYCSANEFTTGIIDENAKLKITVK